MSKKLSYLTSLVLVLAVANTNVTKAQMVTDGLVGYWSLDKNTIKGDTVEDVWGDNDGTIQGDPKVVAGRVGDALEFDGDDSVDIVGTDTLNFAGKNEFTVTVWVNAASDDPVQGVVAGCCGTIVAQRDVTGWALRYDGRNPGQEMEFIVQPGWQGDGGFGAARFTAGAWHHLAGVVDNDRLLLYVDGALEKEMAYSGPMASGGPETEIGHATDGGFIGLIDEVAIYDRALSAEEVKQNFEAKGLTPSEQAADPLPGDEVVDVPRNVTLAWTPGEFAATHNVYLGTAFDDVNNADTANPSDVLVSQNQGAPSFDAGILEFDQTYFWRVDEVNSAPDFTVFGGGVWSFSVEPIARPVTAVTAKASSSFGASGPEKTIDGSGLVDDLHGVSAADMWISGAVPATIEYAFDRAYKLHELWIWNSNQLIEAFVGFGAKDVVVEHSLDGENWTVLEGVGPLAQATGAAGYAQNNAIDFGGVTAQHVRVTVNSVQGIAPQASLSEVRFYYIPTFATRPSPASGATDVSPDVPLAWGRDGREAGSHEVYLGTDADNLSLAGGVSESSFDTAAVDLQLGQTYYWRVDEVNDAMDPSTWTGDIWSFTTADAIVIDDMESYKDAEFLEIWATWVDGFDDPANGALVGANPGIGDFSPESTIVQGGNQSLPIHYDNSAAAQSEATRTFAVALDWTRAGVTQLVVWFHGAAGNTGQLYLKVNGTKIPYQGPAGNIALAAWQPWSIDLASLGMNLQSVRSLAVGIEGNGATGTLYVDDISLEQSAAEAISEWRVSASSDDAEEHILDGGVMESLTSSDLELGYEGNMAPAALQTIGCRWVGVAVPQGATITEAWVQFSADDIDNPYHALPVSLVIAGQLSPNPETFAATAGSISGRATTSAQVVWDIPQWTIVHAMGPEERSPDISSIIQEIVNQPGWSGEAIVLMFGDNPASPSEGAREAESFDGSASGAPLLHISFE